VPRDAKPTSVDLPRARAALAALELAGATLKSTAARARLAAHIKEESMAPRPPKPAGEKKATQTAIRLTNEDADRCERLASKMSEAAGVDVTKSAAMRAALTAGLEVLELKLGLSAPPKIGAKAHAKRSAQIAAATRAPRGGS